MELFLSNYCGRLTSYWILKFELDDFTLKGVSQFREFLKQRQKKRESAQAQIFALIILERKKLDKRRKLEKAQLEEDERKHRDDTGANQNGLWAKSPMFQTTPLKSQKKTQFSDVQKGTNEHKPTGFIRKGEIISAIDATKATKSTDALALGYIEGAFSVDQANDIMPMLCWIWHWHTDDISQWEFRYDDEDSPCDTGCLLNNDLVSEYLLTATST